MLKLKKNSIERLVNAYRKHLEKVEGGFCLRDLYEGERISFGDFEEVEELKPYVRYPREMFDGNPKHYWTIERFNSGGVSLFSRNYPNNELADSTTHFMYIEPFEEQDHDAS